jgi:hypothetical protein
MFSRLRIALGRIGESEDDELAYAYYCGNQPDGAPYDHAPNIAGYMSRAMGFYRYRHMERAVGMILKAIGLPPRGRFSRLASWGAWRLMRSRYHKFRAQTP